MISRRHITPEQAQSRLEALCARAEHCRWEMSEKLRAWGITPAESRRIIEGLVEGRYVDDARFAAAFVRDKLRFSGWGRRKIAMALAAKHIDRSVVQGALADIDPDEYAAVLSRLVRSRAARQPELLQSYEGRRKLLAFCLSRGFESALAASAIRETQISED